MVKFDILSEHSHEDNINHLNVTLLQEKNETLDDACPNIYNTELSYHQNSEPLLLNYLKESTQNICHLISIFFFPKRFLAFYDNDFILMCNLAHFWH